MSKNTTSNIKNLLSDLEELIISALRNGEELYGLEITKKIESKTEGEIKIGFGSLYPALRRLESKKFVEARWGEDLPEEREGARRRYYKVTAEGLNAYQRKRSIFKKDIHPETSEGLPNV